MALRALGLAPNRPPTALIADLEAQMYSCDCPATIYYWDLAKGLRTWAALNDLKLAVRTGVVKSRDPKERLAPAEVQKALASGAAVVATYAVCSKAAQSADAAYRCQQRVSVVVTGLDANAKRLVVLLPDRLPEKERAYLRTAGATLGKSAGGAVTASLPFAPKTGNLTVTFLGVVR